MPAAAAPTAHPTTKYNTAPSTRDIETAAPPIVRSATATPMIGINMPTNPIPNATGTTALDQAPRQTPTPANTPLKSASGCSRIHLVPINSDRTMPREYTTSKASEATKMVTSDSRRFSCHATTSCGSAQSQASPAAVLVAFRVALSRRRMRPDHATPLPPIRSLHYFLPVVEEALSLPTHYLDYVRRRAAPTADRRQDGCDPR